MNHQNGPRANDRPVLGRRRRGIVDRVSALAAGAALVAAGSSAFADTLYWDGSGTSWSSASSWSTAPGATTPDPAAPPGASDIASFVATTAIVAQTVNLDAPQSASGLATIAAANNFLVTIQGGGSNQTLNLGIDGINHVAGGLTIGSATAGQQVGIRLQASQSWNSSTAGTGAAAIVALNDVSIGGGGNQTLTLTGTNTGSSINGAISDGAAVLGLTKTGAGTWTLAGANTFTGTTLVSGGILTVGHPLGLGATSGVNTVSSGGSIGLRGVTVQNESVTINGNGSNNQGALQGVSGDSVWAGPVSIGSGNSRLGAAAGTLTVSGVIANGASNSLAIRNGSGTTILSGANTYTGQTSIVIGPLVVSSINSVATNAGLGTVHAASSNLGSPSSAAAGTLLMGASGVVPTAALVYVGPGETTDRNIQLNGLTAGAILDQSGTGPLNFVGGFSKTGAGAETFTLRGDSASPAEITANLVDGASGALSLAKTGAGLWTVSGAAHTYTGPTSVNGGVLNFSPAAGTTTNLGTLAFAGGDGTLQSTDNSGTQTLAFSSLSPRSAGATGNFVTSGGVNGTTNSINLGGVSAGVIDPGIYFSGSAYAWSDGPGTPVRAVNYGTDSGTFTTGPAASLSSANGLHQQITGAVTDQATDTLSTLNIVGTSNLTLAAAQTLTVSGVLKSGAGSSTISGGTGIQAATGGELVIRTAAADTLLISAPILDNTASRLTKSGPGTLTLTATTSTYAGPTVINGGTLGVNNANALGATPATTTPGNIVINGGTLRVDTGFTLPSVKGITLGTAGVNQLITNSGNLNYGGVIAGSGASLTIASGTGLWVPGGASTYSGGTTLAPGSYTVPTGSSAGAAGSVTSGPLGTGPITLAGGRLRSTTGSSVTLGNPIVMAADTTFPSGATNDKVLTLSGPATITGGTRTLTVSTASAGAIVFSNTISDLGNGYGLTKNGTGHLLLSGDNIYTGATTVSDGRLTLTGSLAGPATATVAGTLTGTGTIAGLLTVGAGGHVNPGTVGGIGLLVANGGISSTTSTSNLDFEIGAPTTPGVTYDAITALLPGATDTLTNSVFNISDVGGAVADTPYHLIHWTGSTAPDITGHTLNLPQFYVGSLSVDEVNKNVNLTFTTVPEPASMGLLGVAALGLLRRRARPRRR